MSRAAAVSGGGFELIPGNPLDTLVMPSGLTRGYVDGRPIAELVRKIHELEILVPTGDGDDASKVDDLLAENETLKQRLDEARERLSELTRGDADQAVWRAAARAAAEIVAACRITADSLDHHGRPLGDRWKMYQYHMRLAHGLHVESKE